MPRSRPHAALCVTVAHLDHAHLLQALERLAQRLERHPEVGRQRALARELLARRIAAGEDGLEEVGKDALGGVLNSRRVTARGYQSSELW